MVKPLNPVYLHRYQRYTPCMICIPKQWIDLGKIRIRLKIKNKLILTIKKLLFNRPGLRKSSILSVNTNHRVHSVKNSASIPALTIGAKMVRIRSRRSVPVYGMVQVVAMAIESMKIVKIVHILRKSLYRYIQAYRTLFVEICAETRWIPKNGALSTSG